MNAGFIPILEPYKYRGAPDWLKSYLEDQVINIPSLNRLYYIQELVSE